MELKNYQQDVLKDLAEYIQTWKEQGSLSKAFSSFWKSRGIHPLQPGDPTFHPYCDTMKGTPNITIKVPTAGGKTFIACNALATIFDAMPMGKTKAVAWFVPSDTILKQTYQNLKNPLHPYRQKIDTLFNGRVEVYDKQALLYGQNFNPIVVEEQLSIFVLSIQSFASTAKDKRLVYSENEHLTEFTKTYNHHEKRIEGADETSLIQVIAHLNPVMIIDESHNFEGNLRVDTLTNINPSFVLNLTATPREKSNIISFVSPARLKNENMVKLPVMVSNYPKHADVINSAIALRKNLEDKAKEEENLGGDYIRPIVLFQAQPKNDEDDVTFTNIKNSLVKAGISEEEIKIKTANLNELKGIDLMSRDCPVRYIITINALKEGWDCPFAYILASTANRSSKIDVEQILGCILRQPYTRQHDNVLLNMSYVLTSSANFHTTIDNVVESLRLSGYSRKDYVATDTPSDNFMQPKSQLYFRNDEALHLTYANSPVESEPNEWEFNSEDIILPSAEAKGKTADEKGVSLANDTAILMKKAESMSQQYEQDIQESLNNKTSEEVMQKTRTYAIQDRYKPFLESINLPQFCIKVNKDYGVFGITKDFVPLTQEALLEDFKLSKEDKHIDFSYSNTNVKKIDIDKNDEDNIITSSLKEKEALMFDNFYGSINDKDKIIQHLSKSIIDNITRDNSVSDADLYKYVTSVLEDKDLPQLRNLGKNTADTIQAFKNKIRQLKIAFAKEQFDKKIQSKQIEIEYSEHLPSEIILTKDKAPAFAKKMYQEEEGFNDFERDVIDQVISLDCVRCWHRNQEKGKGFCINGYVNAYPDFIIVLNNGITVLLETKGSHLDGSDSKNKIACGNKWAVKAGSKFAYFMVFEDKPIQGAVTVGEFIKSLIVLGGN